MFQPTTRHCLEPVEAVGEATLSELLAEAMRSEVTGTPVTADRAILGSSKEREIDRLTIVLGSVPIWMGTEGKTATNWQEIG